MSNELVIVLIVCILILLFSRIRKLVVGKLTYIGPLILLTFSYVIYILIYYPDKLSDLGIRFDNIQEASILAIGVFFPALLIILLYSYKFNRFKFNLSFIFILFIYPLFGFAQQIIFQSIFHSNLIRLGLAPWSVFIVAMLFTIAHYPVVYQIPISFFWGIVTSTMFLICPNVLTIGLIHGLLGALFFEFVLEKDVVKNLFKSFNSK